MKYFFLFTLIFVTIIANSQNSYDQIIQNLKSNSEYSDSVLCIGSTMLAKAEYYFNDSIGYVVIYIKRTEDDIFGKPYLFCGISSQRWQSFRNGGLSSWGQSYHDYIKPYVCNSQSNNSYNRSEYQTQQPNELPDVSIIHRNLQLMKQNNNNTTYYEPEKVNIGKYDLNYKFAIGYGLGLNSDENSNQFTLAFKVGRKATIETLYNKYTKNTNSNILNDLYEKQYGLTSIYNWNSSFFSENLFFVLGLGVSYSKTLQDNSSEYENETSFVFNLGLDYNFDKIPVSLGLYNRLDFGRFSSTGLCLKYIYK
jgi:hypothetical protein